MSTRPAGWSMPSAPAWIVRVPPLIVAVDGGATAAERQIAYKRVREELEGLIVVSDNFTCPPWLCCPNGDIAP